jgi:MSHA biogenesis protein MshI
MEVGPLFGLFNRKKGVLGLVGVSWHDQHLSLAHVQQRGGNPVLLRCESAAAANIKEAGQILADKVKAQGLTGARCNFVLDPEDYNLLLVEAPAVEDAELAAAAKWKIKDMVDRPLEQLAISVFRVPREAYRNQRDMLYVVAADRKRVQQAVDLVHESGLVLESIDIPELAILNVLALCADDSNGIALIDLRFSGSLLNLSRNGNLYLTRHLNTQLADDIDGNADWETVRERLVLEIQRSLDYYESQMGQTHINRVLLAPRKQDSDSLVTQLNQAMGVKVETLDLGSKLDSAVELVPETQHACLFAIGGALRQAEAAR